MDMDFQPKNLRRRFKELTAEFDKRIEKLEPLHKELADHVAASTKAEKVIREKILKVKDGMFDLENERAAIARALGGKTADPDEE